MRCGGHGVLLLGDGGRKNHEKNRLAHFSKTTLEDFEVVCFYIRDRAHFS